MALLRGRRLEDYDKRERPLGSLHSRVLSRNKIKKRNTERENTIGSPAHHVGTGNFADPPRIAAEVG